MDTLLSVDVETTGDHPFHHQCYEFAAVPIIKGIIRPDLSYHRYIKHMNYKFTREVIFKFGERISKKPESVKEVGVGTWGKEFIDFLEATFKELIYLHGNTVTLLGVNIGGFDFKFMQEMLPSLRSWKHVSYSCCEVKSMYIRRGDTRMPTARECIGRAREEGAPIKFNLNHTALEDALVTAEIYSWKMFGRVIRAHDDQNFLPTELAKC